MEEAVEEEKAEVAREKEPDAVVKQLFNSNDDESSSPVIISKVREWSSHQRDFS